MRNEILKKLKIAIENLSDVINYLENGYGEDLTNELISSIEDAGYVIDPSSNKYHHTFNHKNHSKKTGWNAILGNKTYNEYEAGIFSAFGEFQIQIAKTDVKINSLYDLRKKITEKYNEIVVVFDSELEE